MHEDKSGMTDVYKANDRNFRIAYVVCEEKQKDQRAEDIANARLIAAAPDLLAAMEAYSAAIHAYRETGYPDYARLLYIDDAARAAVAKAKGLDTSKPAR
jgi:hypothetical protein